MKKSCLIIGMGRFGQAVATSLFDAGCEVLALDQNREIIEEIQNSVTHAVIGDCTEETVLSRLGVRNFDVAVVATGNDEKIQTSIMVTVMLKELGAPYVVARATNDLHARVLKKVGADKVIMPERDMGVKFAQAISSANILNWINLSDEYSVVEMATPKKWVGRSIREINVRSVHGITIVVIRRGTELIVSPEPDFVLSGSDTLVIAGHNKNIDKLRG